MSTAEVVPPTSVPNIQETTPNLNDVIQEPGKGPDGRTDGEDVKTDGLEQNSKESNENAETKEQEQSGLKEESNDKSDSGNTAKSNEVKQQDVSEEKKSDNNETEDSKEEPLTNRSEQNQDNKKKMEGVNAKSKGTAKITDIKTVTSVEKPDGKALEEESPGHVVDIVKQSKLKESLKQSTSELGEFPEFPQSRPLTETSFRDGTKMSYDTERERREPRSDTERDSRTPFSVRIERKPLHTAVTRSHSDYYSKSPGTSRFTYIAGNLHHYTGFQTDLKGQTLHQQRMRRPPKLVRLATVTMSPKPIDDFFQTKPQPRGPSLYYEEPKKPTKVITWDEATDARPPLRIDMEGPGPTHYTPRVKPLAETNSPAWSFGSKCFPEKAGGSRTSWEKTWFQHPDVWTSKVDFYNDSAWPTPLHYRQRPTLGPRQRTMAEPPSFTIGTRKELNLNKRGSDKEPSPADYDKDIADKVILKKAPAFSHQFRREGTVIWNGKDKIPGPGSYSPKYSYNKPHGPSFTIRNLRREKSHILGPFSTF